MNINKRTIVGGVVIIGVLWYAGTHSEGLDPASTPAPAATSSQDVAVPDCFHVPADGQSHPCDIPASTGGPGTGLTGGTATRITDGG